MVVSKHYVHVFYTHPSTASQLNELVYRCIGLIYIDDEIVNQIIKDILFGIKKGKLDEIRC